MMACVALAGCKQEQTDVTPMAPGKAKTPWSIDYGELQLKLRGAWLVQDVGYLGSIQAWNVEGTKVTVYDPKKKTEQVGEISFDAPCDLTLWVKTAYGPEGWGAGLAVDGETIYLGLGNGGVKKGDEVVACIGPGVYYMKGSECSLWTEDFGEWRSKPATCTVDEKSFKGKSGDASEDELDFFKPGVLMTDQLAGKKAGRHGDWAAAKAKADELAAQQAG